MEMAMDEVPTGGDSFAEFETYEDFLNSQVC